MSYYDPKAHGALCHLCVLSKLRDGGPVEPERHHGARFTVVAEQPRPEDVDKNRPLVSDGGMMATNIIAENGVKRHEVNWTLALLCRPPMNDMERLRNSHRKLNKIRKEKGLQPVPSPEQCCWPRLLKELLQTPDIVTFGGTPFQTVTHCRKSVMEVRGGPLDGYFYEGRFYQFPERFPGESDGAYDGRCLALRPVGSVGARVMPTVSPSFLMHKRSFLPAFKVDIARAVRWFKYGLSWKEPKITYNPNPVTLRQFLSSHKTISCDIETTMADPLENEIYCIGFSTDTEAMVVGFKSVETGLDFYEPHDREAINAVIKKFLSSKSIRKIGHNFGYFDRLVLERVFDCHIENVLDTILLHRGAESELPHKLAYVGSMFTDAPSWKSDGTREDPRDDQALHHYNALDCVITMQVVPPLVEQCKIRKTLPAVKVDHRLQEICAGLHRTGMLVDQTKRAEYDVKYKEKAHTLREHLRAIVGSYKFNPNSVQQLGELLFKKWQLPVVNETTAGEPSTDDETIRKLMLDYEKDPKILDFLRTLRDYRKSVKIRGYLKQCLPREVKVTYDELALSEDEDPEALGLKLGVDTDAMSADEFKYRKKEYEKEIKRGILAGGLVFPDGRLRAHYSAHGTTSRRFSSNTPNLQNVPRHLRDMFIPAPGMIYIYSDMDQLELRIITNLSGAKQYLRVFLEGGDPHTVSALSIYGEVGKKVYQDAVARLGPKKFKDDEQFSRMRDFAKRFVYAASYAAKVPTIHDTIISAEDPKTGQLLYPKMEKKVTKQAYDAWTSNNPEIPKWWDDTQQLFLRQGFLTEPVENWRRDFLDTADKVNELVNFPCQSGGVALVHRATIRLIYEMGLSFDKWGPNTGLVNQCHDALIFELPLEVAKASCKLMTEAFAQRVEGWPVPFSGEAKLYQNWRDKLEEKTNEKKT